MKRSRVRKVWVFGIVLFVLVLSGFSEAVEPPAIEWRKNLGGNKYDMGYSVQQTSDGGYIVAGETSSFGAGDLDAYLIKTDSKGNLLWQKTFGEEMKEETAWSVQQTTDNGYIMVGWKKSLSDIYLRDIYLIKTDSSGELQWEKTFGKDWTGYGLFRDWYWSGAYSVQQTSDGGYILAGWQMSYMSCGSHQVYLVRTSASGNLLWQENIGGITLEFSLLQFLSAYARSIYQTSDGGYIVAGLTDTESKYEFGLGPPDIYLIKIAPEGENPTLVENQEKGDDLPEAFVLFQNYPNPFNLATEINFVLPNTSYVTLEVFNSLGQKIEILVDGKRGAGKYRATWDGTGFPSGVYFYCLETEGFNKTMKMLLMK